MSFRPATKYEFDSALQDVDVNDLLVGHEPDILSDRLVYTLLDQPIAQKIFSKSTALPNSYFLDDEAISFIQSQNH